MIVSAAVLDVAFLLVAFGARTWLQRHRTGDHGWRLGRSASGAEAAARLLMFGAALLLITALVVVRPASLQPWSACGIVIAGFAIVLVAVAQVQMGESWRIGVDPHERTELIRDGTYAHVRNPIYTGMVVFAIGQALILPSVWSLGAVAAMAIGVEIQARVIEEPYLRQVHGSQFEQWASVAGRFVPRVGRLPSPQSGGAGRHHQCDLGKPRTCSATYASTSSWLIGAIRGSRASRKYRSTWYSVA